MKRDRLIAGGAVGFLSLLIILGLILLSGELRTRRTQVNQREPLQGLGYCDSTQTRPCIVSFSRDGDGRMLVNILTQGASLPDFYLKIIHSQGESIYPCEEVRRFSTSVYCTGKALPLGEIYEFYLLSNDDNTLLAQGNFSIIGMALATIQVLASPPRGTPLADSTAEGFITPTPGLGTPTRTPTRTPSYPNPSAYP